MKPPGTCSPGQPRLSPEQSSGQPWQPGLPVREHHGRGGQPPEQLLHSRDESRSNSETKTPSSSQRRSFHPCSAVPSQAALLGRVPHRLPQGQRPVSPAPLARRHLHTQRCFCRDGCTTPLSSCFLCITSGLTQAGGGWCPILRRAREGGVGVRGVVSGAEGGMAEVMSFQGWGTKVRGHFSLPHPHLKAPGRLRVSAKHLQPGLPSPQFFGGSIDLLPSSRCGTTPLLASSCLFPASFLTSAMSFQASSGLSLLLP